MRSRHGRVLILCITFFLTSCGGDGNSASAINQEKVTPPSLPNNSIKGTISSAASMLYDSDLNDPLTIYKDNSLPKNAQLINNFVTIQGFVSEIPTKLFSIDSFSTERSLDRFYLTADPSDFFKVQLNAGQIIQLEVSNFENQREDGVPFYGNIDLELLDQDLNLIAYANSINELKQINVPTTGTYFIHVNAFVGASKYVLQLQPNDQDACGAGLNNSSIDFVNNELIVQYKEGFFPQSTSINLRKLHSDTRRATLAYIDPVVAAQSIPSTPDFDTLLSKINPQTAAKRRTLKTLKTLQQQPNVEHASLNYIRHPQKVPNDTYYHYQWHYPAIKLPQAWDITTGTPEIGDVIVAVIDTGIFSSHPELRNKIITGYDFISNNLNSGDNQPGIDDNPEDPGDGQDAGSSSWHGTHVAGTIAADTNNASGIAGVSWGAKIMPIRALGKNGGTSYDLMQAVRYAAGMSNDSNTLPSKPADIINLSLGGPGESEAEKRLYKQIYDQGIIIVAAAGNENTSSPSFPASYPGVLSVSATTFSKTKAPYSNTGNFIDIAAPGGDLSKNNNGDDQPDGILSTLVDDSNETKKSIFGFYQGTSMATPHVSGTIALMKAIYPTLNATIVENLLANNLITDDLGEPGRDSIFGHGQINALKAVQQAQLLNNGGNLPTSPAVILANPNSLQFSDASPENLVISNEGGSQASVTQVQTNAEWLTVNELQVDQDGLGTYQVVADNSALDPGVYLSSINFTFDNAPTLCVRTSINVGAINSEGNFPITYVLLYDINNNQVQDGIAVDGINNTFEFSRVPESTYILIAGSDIDNDGFICQNGETCAVYPANGQVQAIDTRIRDSYTIDLTTSILNSLNGISLASVQFTNFKVGIALPSTLQKQKIAPAIKEISGTER